MKIIPNILLAVFTLGCVNGQSNKKKELVKNEIKQSLEIKYSESRGATISELKKIWKCKTLFISKDQTNFNGKISNEISIIISDFKITNQDLKRKNFKKTTEVIKNTVLNYNEFSELKIILSNTNSEGERKTSSKTIEL